MILSKDSDSSVFQRLAMWSAAIQAISDSPFFGYGISERFNALEPYLYNFKFKYSHPHNDIFAGLIAGGFLGGVTVTISLVSAFLAALIDSQKSSEKILLGLLISLTTLITAIVSTVMFNDISSAWLAFSVYLIWATDFNGTDTNLKK